MSVCRLNKCCFLAAEKQKPRGCWLPSRTVKETSRSQHNRPRTVDTVWAVKSLRDGHRDIAVRLSLPFFSLISKWVTHSKTRVVPTSISLRIIMVKSVCKSCFLYSLQQPIFKNFNCTFRAVIITFFSETHTFTSLPELRWFIACLAHWCNVLILILAVLIS